MTVKSAPTAWIAPNATLVGSVSIGERVGVWYQAVLRGDGDPIEIGDDSNIQDGCVVHTDPGFPVSVGRHVSVGHGAILHGCRVGDGTLVGMGAIIMNGADVGAESLVAAGALVPEGMVIPPRSLVAGVPGKVRRELSDDEIAANRKNASDYVQSAQKAYEQA